MTGPRKSPGKTSKNMSSLEQGLDRSRKHKLWLTSNTIGVFLMVGFVALAISRIVNDIRGEYTGKIARMGMVRLSIDHRDGQLLVNLNIPHTHPLRCTTPESNTGDNVDWSFTDAYRPTATPVVSFHGQAQSGSITGVLQDNLNVLNCFPIKMQRDDLASVFRQIRDAVPGWQESYDPQQARQPERRPNKSTR